MARRQGFTLIELLIVVVIIGILATIAIPKFQNTKGKANAATIKSDLKNLATAQEAYLYEHATYATTLGVLNFKLSPGVSVVIEEASGAGWSATATHPAATPLICAIYAGAVAPPAPAISEGQVRCE
jgi:type IV pilus assembly protein PilA